MNLTRWIVYILILGLIICAAMFYSWIFKYLVCSIVFAYIFNPWVSWLERKHIPRSLGILITYLLIGFFIVWGLTRIVPVIIDQANSLLAFIKSSSADGDISLLKIPFIQDLQKRIDYIEMQIPILKLHNQFLSLLNSLNNSLMHIPDLLINNYQKILEAVSLIATIPIIGFFLLKDNVQLKKSLLKLVPNQYFEIVIIIMHKIDEVLGKYLRAMFYEIIIVGSLASIALTLLGIPYSVLIGFSAGVANIIPYFGPWLGGLFAVMSILLAGLPPITILYAAIAMYLVQVIDNNIVYPLVVGMSIEMHPLIVLLTVLAGGWAWGLVGMLVSVPIVYLIFSVTKVFYVSLKQFKLI